MYHKTEQTLVIIISTSHASVKCEGLMVGMSLGEIRGQIIKGFDGYAKENGSYLLMVLESNFILLFFLRFIYLKERE